MKNFIFFVVACLTASLPCSAQNGCDNPSCRTNSLIINTGYNPSTSSAYSVPGQDPYWVLTNAPTTVTVNLNGPSNVIASVWGGNTTIDPTSRYISAFSSAGSNLANINQSINPYRFERCFCVCEDNVTVSYKFTVRVDNQVKFYIDGILLSGQPAKLSQTAGANFDNNDNTDNQVQGTIVLKKGRHCLQADLRNDNAYSAMGLNIKGTLSASGNSLIKDDCCNNQGFVVGYKYNDKNCNGIKDSNEPVLPNWQINLTGNGVTQNCTTDANGYFSFTVPTGNYSISEVMQNGWGATKPIGGVQNNVVVSQNSITQIDFLNCNNPPVSTVCCPELKNLIVNPDFNNKVPPLGFTSQYSYDNSSPSINSLLPGEQAIINTMDVNKICSNWAIKNSCAQNFLLTNGANNQNTGPKLVWQEKVNNLKSGTEYKFCAKVFNLINCCFSVTPKVDIKFSIPGYDIIGQSIDDVNLPLVCDFWREIKKNIVIPSGTNSVTIQIFLHESASGDGNDLGIDDIGFVELPKTPDERTYFNISHSSNTGFMATVVDQGLKDCGVWWKVCECDDQNVCKAGTVVENPSRWWTYPTPVQFWGYNGTSNLVGTAQAPPGVFDKKLRYKIELGVWCECTSWNGNAYIWNPATKNFIKINPSSPNSNK